MPSEFNPRILTASRGKLAFTWNIHMSTIHMYEWEDGADEPTQNLGMLYSIGADGNVVEFDQEAFEAHIDWFLAGAATAEITEPPRFPHDYPGALGHNPDDPGECFTSDCRHGCGCWAGPSRSGGPEGVDPFGECPKHKEAGK
jgi:hypothetical protein